MAYQVDCLFAAVSVLAGHGHIKQRLISAYEQHVAKVCDEDLPVVLREPFAELREKMYRVAPLNGEGPICASVRKMSVEEASACAVSIVGLCQEVARYDTGRKGRPPVADADAGEPVPPFLVKTS
jgi:hypothetical protein